MAKAASSSIAEDVRGILFLGVPHRGTKAAFWASLLSCTAKWRGSSTTLLEYMSEDAQAINDLQVDFRDGFVLRRHHLIQQLPYVCDFIEQRPEKASVFALGPVSQL